MTLGGNLITSHKKGHSLLTYLFEDQNNAKWVDTIWRLVNLSLIRCLTSKADHLHQGEVNACPTHPLDLFLKYTFPVPPKQ